MSPEHLRVVSIVYGSALLPLVLIPILIARGHVPHWVARVYIASFLACPLWMSLRMVHL